jgi:hypothetical protein
MAMTGFFEANRITGDYSRPPSRTKPYSKSDAFPRIRANEREWAHMMRATKLLDSELWFLTPEFLLLPKFSVAQFFAGRYDGESDAKMYCLAGCFCEFVLISNGLGRG